MGLLITLVSVVLLAVVFAVGVFVGVFLKNYGFLGQTPTSPATPQTGVAVEQISAKRTNSHSPNLTRGASQFASLNETPPPVTASQRIRDEVEGRTPKESFTIKLEDPSDRRLERRHPYFCKQWVAPYDGRRMPEAEEFFCVQCRDISAGAVSFFMDDSPEFQMVIIRLAGPNEPKILTARLQRITPSTNPTFGEFIIACQFLGTIHCDALPSKLDKMIAHREKEAILAAAGA